MNYIDPKEFTPSNDNYLPLDTALYPRILESSDVIFLFFFAQKCCDTLFNHFRQKKHMCVYIYIYIYIYIYSACLPVNADLLSINDV